MINFCRISKFGAKKQNSEEDSVVELTSCIIEVMQGFNSGILIQLDLYLHLYLYQQVEGELLTIQCDNAGSLELARETLQQFFSKPPAPKPKVTVARLVHFLYSLESIFSALQVMLSRVEILSLAASPSSMSAPKNWVSLNFLRIAFFFLGPSKHVLPTGTGYVSTPFLTKVFDARRSWQRPCRRWWWGQNQETLAPEETPFPTVSLGGF